MVPTLQPVLLWLPFRVALRGGRYDVAMENGDEEVVKAIYGVVAEMGICWANVSVSDRVPVVLLNSLPSYRPPPSMMTLAHRRRHFDEVVRLIWLAIWKLV